MHSNHSCSMRCATVFGLPLILLLMVLVVSGCEPKQVPSRYGLFSIEGFAARFASRSYDLKLDTKQISSFEFKQDASGKNYAYHEINSVSGVEFSANIPPDTNIQGVIFRYLDNGKLLERWAALKGLYATVAVFEASLTLDEIVALCQTILAQPSGKGLYSPSGNNVFYYPVEADSIIQIVITPPGSIYSTFK